MSRHQSHTLSSSLNFAQACQSSTSAKTGKWIYRSSLQMVAVGAAHHLVVLTSLEPPKRSWMSCSCKESNTYKHTLPHRCDLTPPYTTPGNSYWLSLPDTTVTVNSLLADIKAGKQVAVPSGSLTSTLLAKVHTQFFPGLAGVHRLLLCTASSFVVLVPDVVVVALFARPACLPVCVTANQRRRPW